MRLCEKHCNPSGRPIERQLILAEFLNEIWRYIIYLRHCCFFLLSGAALVLSAGLCPIPPKPRVRNPITVTNAIPKPQGHTKSCVISTLWSGSANAWICDMAKPIKPKSMGMPRKTNMRAVQDISPYWLSCDAIFNVSVVIFRVKWSLWNWICASATMLLFELLARPLYCRAGFGRFGGPHQLQ